MKTVLCRNCGISYQSTATICLRCMNPLDKSEDGKGKEALESTVLHSQERLSSMETKNINSGLESQTKSGKLVQQASPRPARMKYEPEGKYSEVDLSSTEEIKPPQPKPNPIQGEEDSPRLETVHSPSEPLKESSAEPKSNVLIGSNQDLIKQLEDNLNIHAVSKIDIFSKNGYVLTNGPISHLNLSNLKIEKIPSVVYELKDLEYLNLSQTNIADLLPNISGLTNLQEINLYGATIQSLPESLLLLHNLKKLNIFSTPITPDNIVIDQLRKSGIDVVI